MKKSLLISMILLLLTSLSSCFGGSNISSIMFPISMGIEYENGTYKVLYQVIDPSLTSTIDLESSKDIMKVNVITGVGNSLFEAMQNIDYKGNKTISTSHIRSIILSKTLIDNLDATFIKVLFYFIGDPQYRKNTYLYVTDNNIYNLYQTVQNLGFASYYSLYNTPNQTSINNVLKPITLIDTTANYLDNYRTTYFPFIGLIFNEGEYTTNNPIDLKLVLRGACFSQNDQNFNINCITNDYLEGYKWMQNITNVVISPSSNENEIKANVNSSKTTFTYQNDKLKITINIDLSILFDYSALSISDMANMFAEKIKTQVITTYQYAYSQNIDIYNLKDFVSRNYNKTYSLINELDVNVIVNINTKGKYS
jgi:Ger(x)C family germination protein